jgi:hypothetical protein
MFEKCVLIQPLLKLNFHEPDDMFDMEGEGNCYWYIPQHGIHLYFSGMNVGDFFKVIGEYEVGTFQCMRFAFNFHCHILVRKSFDPLQIV